MPAAKILLVDDSGDDRRLVQRLLSPAFEVHAVSDFVDAMPFIMQGDFDLVLVDVNMPELSGDQVVNILSNTMGSTGLPVQRLPKVVLFSAMDEAALSKLAKEAGADGHICKVYTREELLRSVRGQLGS